MPSKVKNLSIVLLKPIINNLIDLYQLRNSRTIWRNVIHINTSKYWTTVHQHIGEGIQIKS